jgi:putative ABC transport system substrate-binding protein
MRRAFVLAVPLVATLLLSGSSTVAIAQPTPTPPLAQDGRGLSDETVDTRAAFTALWADQAGARWVQEHDRALSAGQAPHGPRIGFLYAGSAAQNPAFTQGLASGLRAVGYTPGQDIRIVWRFADGRNERLPSLAAELVQLPVDVIVTPAVAESTAARQVTSTIPIITLTVADPVGAGLAASLQNPGGNVTGVIQQPFDFNRQRLAFLRQAVPDATRIGVLVSVVSPTSGTVVGQLRSAAESMGIDLQILEVRSADDLAPAFEALVQQPPDAMMVLADTLFTANRPRLVQLARDARIPTLYPGRSFVEAGGLMDFAFVEASRGQLAAEYISQILHGADPGNLPMEPPAEVELVVNLNAAEAIGYTVPPSVLAQATDVIR